MAMGAEEKELIRRAYYVERKSVRQIAREGGRSRKTVRQVVENEGRGVKGEQGKKRGRRGESVYEPYRRRVEELLEEQEKLPVKQRYTAAKIYEVIREEGYGGCESRVRQEVGKWKHRGECGEVYVPLSYEPGEDAQCDWGEAVVVLGGREVKVQVFVLRMCYSRKLYVQAFPTQRLECFLQAHMDAFAYFGGVPQRISYDNVATAVHISHEGGERKREETRSFVGLRSHYLFESRFCTPFAPQEKGGVENGVGYMRERMFVPLPRVKSYEELNGLLRKRCDRENERKVRGETKSIGEMWEQERRQLRAMPEGGYACAEIREARVTPYSQVIFETNRYSVPVKRGRERGSGEGVCVSGGDGGGSEGTRAPRAQL